MCQDDANRAAVQAATPLCVLSLRSEVEPQYLISVLKLLLIWFKRRKSAVPLASRSKALCTHLDDVKQIHALLIRVVTKSLKWRDFADGRCRNCWQTGIPGSDNTIAHSVAEVGQILRGGRVILSPAQRHHALVSWQKSRQEISAFGGHHQVVLMPTVS